MHCHWEYPGAMIQCSTSSYKPNIPSEYCSADNLFILFDNDRTFPTIIDGRHCLYLLLSLGLPCLAVFLLLLFCPPPLHPSCVFLQISAAMSGSCRQPNWHHGNQLISRVIIYIINNNWLQKYYYYHC